MPKSPRRLANVRRLNQDPDRQRAKAFQSTRKRMQARRDYPNRDHLNLKKAVEEAGGLVRAEYAEVYNPYYRGKRDGPPGRPTWIDILASFGPLLVALDLPTSAKRMKHYIDTTEQVMSERGVPYKMIDPGGGRHAVAVRLRLWIMKLERGVL